MLPQMKLVSFIENSLYQPEVFACICYVAHQLSFNLCVHVFDYEGAARCACMGNTSCNL